MIQLNLRKVNFMKDTAFCALESCFIEYKDYTTLHNMPVQHYHDSYEIYFLISGTRNHFVNGEYFRINTGDVMLMKPFELHYSTSPNQFHYERYVLNIKKHELMSIFTAEETEKLFDIFKYRVFHLNEIEQTELLDLFQSADKEKRKNHFLSEKLFKAITAEILLFLRNIPGTKRITASPMSDNDIIRAVRYINDRYRSNITLDDVTSHLHMSKYHFCRVFKQFTGATFLQYLNNLRLTEAHQLLLYTKKTINEISAVTGFNSTAHLTRTFNQIYGISPRSFRKIHGLQKGDTIF